MYIQVREQERPLSQAATQRVVMDFDLAGALFERQGDDLLILSETGKETRVTDFFNAAGHGHFYFHLTDGSTIDDLALLDRYSEKLTQPDDAQAEQGSSGGLPEYSDTAGELIGSIERLDTLAASKLDNAEELDSFAVNDSPAFAMAKTSTAEAPGKETAPQLSSDSGTLPTSGLESGAHAGSDASAHSGLESGPTPVSDPGTASGSDAEFGNSPTAPVTPEAEAGQAAGPSSGLDTDSGAEPEPVSGSEPALSPEQDPASSPAAPGEPASPAPADPVSEPEIFDPFTYAVRAVLYAKNALPDNDAYGVKTILLENTGNGLEPAASGAPDSISYMGGNTESYLAYTMDAQSGQITFYLTAQGLTAITKAGAPDMEFYYTIAKDGVSYTVQVIMTAKDVFNSAEYHSQFTEFAASEQVSEWHNGKTGLGKTYSIASSDNADYITLDTQLTGATISSGAGNDHIFATAAAGKTVLDNNTTINLGAGRDAVTITAVNSSATAQAVAMNKSTIDATGDAIGDCISITGTVKTSTITSGAGNDTVSLNASLLNAVAVDATSSINLGDGDNTLDVTGRVINSKITGGNGADNISLQATVSSSATPALNISEINLGDGANQLNITANGNSATLYSLTAASGSTLRGGDGGNRITINGALKSSTLATGDGNDAITVATAMSGSASLVDSSAITLGAGADNLTIAAARAPGAVNVYALSKSSIDARNGAEGDSITIEGQVRDSNIYTGAGADTLRFSGISSTSATTPAYSGLQSTNRTDFYELNVGDGDNNVSIDYTRDSASATSRSVGMSGYDFTSGSGNDSLSVTADYGVANAYSTYTRAAAFNMGAGADTLTVNGQYGGLNKVNLDMGAGDDRIKITLAQAATPTATPYIAVENSTVNFGAGSDTLTIATTGINTGALKNSTILANGDDLGDKIDITGTVRATDFYMGGGDDALEFRSTVNINTSATGYAAHAGLHSGSAMSHSVIDLGEGNNKLTVISEGTANHETDGTGKMGTVTTANLRSHGVEGYDILAGSGNDQVRIEADYGIYNGKDSSAGTRAESYTEINLGAGNDTLTVDSVYSSVYHAKINMGEGDDYARFSSYKGDFAVLHDAHVDMGSGNDTVEVDYANMVVSSTWWDAKNVSGDYTFDTIKAHSSIDMGDGNDLLMLRSDFVNDSGKDALLKIALPNDNIRLDGGDNQALSLDGMHSGDTVNVGDILGFGGRLAGIVSSDNLHNHDIKNFESLLINVGEHDTSVSLDNLLSFVSRLEANQANDIKSLIVTADNGGNMEMFNANGHNMEHSASNVHIEGLEGDFDAYTFTNTDHETIQIFLQTM